MTMEQNMIITITYHLEPADGELVVWAESDNLPGFTAASNSLEETRKLVREHIADVDAAAVVSERIDGLDRSGGSVVVVVDAAGIILSHNIMPVPSSKPARSETLVSA
jgi:hypothetical protein